MRKAFHVGTYMTTAVLTFKKLLTLTKGLSCSSVKDPQLLPILC